MVVIDGSKFFNFIQQHREKFADSDAINTLMSLRDISRNCCKCERTQKTQILVDYFGSLAHKINEDDRRLIKELNDNQSVQVTMGGQLIVEIL
jgi:hypothetical protein